MREYIDAMPSIRDVEPPQNEFTNVPYEIDFSSGIWKHKLEYSLTVSLGGSLIFVRNCKEGRDERFIFAECFLDSVIPIVQREKLAPYLMEKKHSEERSIEYQSFQAVLVTVGCKAYELQLSKAYSDNPFNELLKLVKKEYSKKIEEKKVFVPWFDLLG